MRWVAIVCVFAISCSAPEFPSVTPEKNAGETLTSEDIAVYEAIVAGYAQGGEVLGMCAPPPPDARHPLSPAEIRTKSARTYLEPSTRQFEWPDYLTLPEDRWAAPGEDWGRRTMHVPHSARVDFTERNRRRALLEDYHPRDLAPVRSEKDKHYTTLSLTLPGYSLPRTAALVCVFCVSSMPYSGSGDYVYLRKENGVWRMAGRAYMWIQ